MTPSFSQRKGLKPIRTVLQVDSMDDGLRSRLWDAVAINYLNDQISAQFNPLGHSPRETMIRKVWHQYFKRPIDTISDFWSANYSTIKNYFFRCEWHEVYDFIEFIASVDPYQSKREAFTANCNQILKQELSGYRFIGKTITQITAEEEVLAIEEASHLTGKLDVVRKHIEQSLNLLSDRHNPDYRNSIKEAISAVEAACRVIGGVPKATLGDAIKKLESKISFHPALKSAFEKLYGYTSDADGIRHALMGETNLGFTDAKYMLVSCSAFVNYVVAKAAESGIELP